MTTQENEQQQNNKTLKQIDFPFKIRHRYGPIKIAGIGKPDNKRQMLKEPIALIIKANYEVDIREDVKEGYIELNRKVGKQEETVRIFNPKSKLLSFPIGGTVYRGWILDEMEAVALPTNIRHDSLVLKRIMEALMLNYEEFKTKQMKVWMKYGLYALIAIIIGIFALGMLNINVASVLGIQSTQNGPQTIQYIIDANTMTQLGTIWTKQTKQKQE